MTPNVPVVVVDLDAITENYRLLREKSAPAEVGAVVKAHAYGLGLLPVAQALYRAGCRTFFVAFFDEAIALRAAFQNVTIIALHGLAESEQAEAVAKKITPTLNHLEALELWRQFSRKGGVPLPAYIHLDTGMNRLGLSPKEQKRLTENPGLLEDVKINGWMSHLACADEFENPMTTEQRDRLAAVLRSLPTAPVSLCNSSGIFWGREYVFDQVRPGLALYGGNPTPHLPNPMHPVFELKAPILQVRDVDMPGTVGYGATHRVTRPGRVATLALGYADGYHRALSNRGLVKIGDHLAPLIGRISMDLITIDVTDVPEAAVSVGAMATLIGPHRTVDAIAAEGNTIAYEIMTSLGAHMERLYQGVGAP